MLLSGRFLLTTASIRLISPRLTVKDRPSTYRALLPFVSCLPPPPRYQSTAAVSYQGRLKKKVTRMWKYSWRNIETFFPLLFPWQHSVGRIGGNFNKISWNKFRAKSRFNPAAPMPEMSPNLARRRFVPAGDALDLAWGHWEGGRALKVDIEGGGWEGEGGHWRRWAGFPGDADLCDADLHKRPGGPRDVTIKSSNKYLQIFQQ